MRSSLHRPCSTILKPDCELTILTANEPFLFYTGVGKTLHRRNGVEPERLHQSTSEVNVKAIEFHVGNGDFESWAKSSLKDQKLAAKLKEIAVSEQKDEKLRKTIVDIAKKRYITQSKELQDATQLF